MIIPVSGAPDISASDTITLQSFCIGYITIDSSDEVCRDIDSDAHTIIDENTAPKILSRGEVRNTCGYAFGYRLTHGHCVPEASHYVRR